MKKTTPDKELEKIDISIPNKASSAFIRANRRAIRLMGQVLVVKNGNLGKLGEDGNFLVIRQVNPPLKVRAGEVIKRSRSGDND